jgi:hypothetical protein
MPTRRFNRQVENLIADMRGLPRDESRSRLRETEPVSELVDRLLRKHHVGLSTPEEAIRDAWREIVGEPNAAYSHPLRIDRERVLVIGVSNPVVRQELMFHKAFILHRLQSIPACHHIMDVVFRTG